jgi:hypothetical protein
MCGTVWCYVVTLMVQQLAIRYNSVQFSTIQYNSVQLHYKLLIRNTTTYSSMKSDTFFGQNI